MRTLSTGALVVQQPISMCSALDAKRPVRSYPRRVPAAFLDLDKTVIARASMVAFGRPLYRAGLLSRWLLLRALYGQLVYLYLGADEGRLARMREAALRLTKGWDQAHVRAIVQETLEEVVDPIIFEEALDLIREHRGRGDLVVIVSASPEEIVAPLGAYLGADAWIATRAKVDGHGRYSGDLEFYSYGPYKVDAIEELARERGLDLSRCHAYSDSITDLPMLECVGHPVAVNPDRALLKVARDREWEVRWFVQPVRLRDRVPMPPAGPTAAVGGGVAAVAAAVVVWWWLHREPDPPPAPAAARLLGRLTPRGASWPRPRRGR